MSKIKLYDILAPVASNNIVNTPSHVVSKMLGSFTEKAWSDRNLKWLCIFSKNAAFEIGLFGKLMNGLKKVIPNENERTDHIVQNMIWSFCPDEGTQKLTRGLFLNHAYKLNGAAYKSVNKHNVESENFLQVEMNNKGEIMAKANGEKHFVKFNCIIGNPPYQENDGDGGHGSSAGALYPAFVLKAKQANPKYMSMVIPARWLTGNGKGTQSFLKEMMESGHLSKITTEERAKDWFKEVDIKGGVMHFLCDATKNDNIVTINGVDQDISDQEVILIDKMEIGIRNKVLAKKTKMFSDVMCGRNPYGITSNHTNWADKEHADTYKCFNRAGNKSTINFANKAIVASKNKDSIHLHKMCLVKASGIGGDGTSAPFTILPNEIVSETYFVMSTHTNACDAENAANYMKTHFSQFMISILKATQNMSKKTFSYLPYLDFSRSYTDQNLYTMFGLSADEISHIEATTMDFPIYRKAKRTKTIDVPNLVQQLTNQ